MSQRRVLMVVLLASFCAGELALGMPQEVVEQGQRATVIVQSPGHPSGRLLGSAFCVGRNGIFVTCGHGILSDNETLTLVFSPGDSTQRLVEAKVIRRDTEHDLAILQAHAPNLPDGLVLGDPSKLYDTMDVAVFGYATENVFGRLADKYPSVSVNLGHITTLRKTDGQVDRISIDATVNRGATGGPVLNDKGEVVGILSNAGFGNRESTVIPSNLLLQLLRNPRISLEPVTIEYDKRHSEQKLVVDVTSFTDPSPDYEVELTIHSIHSTPRVLTSPVTNGTATFKLVPVESEPGTGLQVTARYAKGAMIGTLENRTVKVGDQSVELNAIRTIDHVDEDSDATVTLYDGKRLAGKLGGMDSVKLDMGDAKAKVNLSRAVHVSIAAAERPVRSIGYSIVVKSKGDLVGRVVGLIDLVGAPPVPEGESLEEVGPHIDIGGGLMIAPGAVVATPIVGGPGGSPIAMRTKVSQNVIGFRYHVSKWENRPIIETFDPLYDRATAPAGESVIAKDGYVVGGILVDSDLYTHAVRVIFFKLDQGRINAKDNYMTGWIGTPVSGELPKQLAGHGERVVGVCGRKGLNMDAIGLLVEP